MPSAKHKKRRYTDKKQRREVLRPLYYLASLVFVLIRLFFFLYDRYCQ